MAITIDATVGGTSTNVYATLLETDALAESMFATEAAAWLALSDDETKAPFQVRAHRLVDTLAEYLGERVSSTQSSEWPRWNVPRPGGGGSQFAYQGMYNCYASDEIPRELKLAESQLAIWLASRDQAGDDTFGLSGTAALSALSVGPISLTFRDASSSDGSTYFDDVIVPILERGRLIRTSGRLIR